MEYGKIISITGMGGLYELVGSKKDGAIVKSLDDKTTKFVSSRIHNFSHLESIEVYTVRDNVNLVDLLKAIEASGKALPNDKDSAAVKSFFEEVYPDMDFERVYASDMKKMVKWYSVLKANNVELVLSEPEEEETEEAEEAVQEETKPAKAKKELKEEVSKSPEAVAETKTAVPEKKEKAAEKVSEETDIKEEEAPKKKAARKKKSEE